MRITFCFLFTLIMHVAFTQSSYEFLWESEPGFRKPIAITFDKKNNVFYVANQNWSSGDSAYDSNNRYDGFISKVSIDGKVIQLKWIEELNDPTDLAIKDNQLFITDGSLVYIADVATGKIIHGANSENLNRKNDDVQVISDDTGDGDIRLLRTPLLTGVTVAPNGRVFILDSGAGSIFEWKNNKLQPIVESMKLAGARLEWATDTLMILSGNEIRRVSIKSKNITSIPAFKARELRGITRVSDRYLLINHVGVVFEMKDGMTKRVFSTPNPSPCVMDIEASGESGLILIVHSKLNKLMGYQKNQ